MTLLDVLVRTEWAKALGLTLLHSLWEGAAVTLLLAIVLTMVRSSRVRYAAACVAMLAILIGFGVTLDRLAPAKISHPAAVGRLPFPVVVLADDPPVVSGSTWEAAELLPWLAPLWLAGVLLFQLRCLVSWTAAGRMRRVGVCGPPEEWMERLDGLRARLRMSRPVALLESCFAEVPVVIGHLRPVILMPVGLLAGLPAGQVEAILLHELAHIRRADYLVNLMQTLVEGLLFYHPAVWWISSVIRNERENCCDDLVVLTSGDAHEYATALAALAENRYTMRQAALAATGGNLVKRVRRLLAQPEGPRASIAPVLSVGILIVTGAVALAAWQAPQQGAVPAEVQTATQVPEAPAPQQKDQKVADALKHLRTLVAQNGLGVSRPPQADPGTPPYQKWLNEVVPYIITDQERAEFKGLKTDAERDQFIKAFWDRRNPVPGAAHNEFQEEHYRRIGYTNDRFTTPSHLPGWKTDMGRIYIQYGPPDEIDSHPAGGAYTRPPEQGGATTVTYPFEQWKYRYIQGVGNNVILEFVDKGKTGDYRLTMDPMEKEAVKPREQQEELSERLKSLTREMELSAQRQKRAQELLAQEAAIRTAQTEAAVTVLNLRELEKQLKSQGPDVPQGQLEKLQEMVRSLEAKAYDPIQKQLLLLQEHYPDYLQERQEQLLRQEASLLRLREAPGEQQSVFLSGPGSQAAVVIRPDRHILATIPFEFSAKQYLVSISAVSSDGKTSWSNNNRQVTSSDGSLTVGFVLPAGSYTLKALVKDTASPAEKTYVVNFSVK
jgi:GWxTD domain-containing protein